MGGRERCPAAFVLYPDERSKDVRLSDPNAALASFLTAAASEHADLTVLLYHGAYEDVQTAVENLDEASRPDVVIVGHEQRLIDAKSTGRTIFVSPGEDGNRLGVLELTIPAEGGVGQFSNSFRYFSYVDDPDDPEAARLFSSYLEELTNRAAR